ncbi:hypothetical protein RCL1_003851 [Eukaryota sp. TZLM3-RCL]
MDIDCVYLKPERKNFVPPNSSSAQDVFPGDPSGSLPEPRRTIFGNFHESAIRFPHRQAFGKRLETNGVVSFSFISYSTALQMIEHLSAGLASLGLKKGDRVGILSHSRVEWQLADLAFHRLGLVTVGIYESVRIEDQIHIAQDAGISALLSSTTYQSNAQAVASSFTSPLLAVVNMDNDVGNVFTHTMENLIAIGEENPVDSIVLQEDDIATLIYTSGTSAKSKGAVLSHRNILAGAMSYNEVMPPYPQEDFQEAILSYLPMSHVFERVFQTAALIHSSRIAFFSGSTTTLVQDIGIVKPTIFTCVPRVLQKIFTGIMTNISSSFCLKRLIFHRFLSSKRASVAENRPSPFCDKFFRKTIGRKFGGNLRVVYFGSAKCSPEIVDFLKMVLCVPICQGYGLSETAASGTVTDLDDLTTFHAGTLKGNDTSIRIRSCPSHGYSVTDSPPRGEVEIKSSAVFQGYWKREENCFTSDGYFVTGDVASIIDNRLVIIERLSSSFKTPFGEMVSSDFLEGLYVSSSYVDEVVVTAGDARLVAVCVVSANHRELLSQDYTALMDLILADFERIATENKLRGYEKIGAVHLIGIDLTPESGMLSASMKKKRKEILNNYAEEVTILVNGMSRVPRGTFDPCSCRSDVATV